MIFKKIQWQVVLTLSCTMAAGSTFGVVIAPGDFTWGIDTASEISRYGTTEAIRRSWGYSQSYTINYSQCSSITHKFSSSTASAESWVRNIRFGLTPDATSTSSLNLTKTIRNSEAPRSFNVTGAFSIQPTVYATVEENNTAEDRACYIDIIDNITTEYWSTLNNSTSKATWRCYFIQKAGQKTVTVTLDSNEGTPASHADTYSYSVGSTYRQYWGNWTHTGGWQYSAMPSTTRIGYVFDAWYTVSPNFPEVDGVRIDENTKTTARVTTIKAHWLLAAVENLQATQDREDMVRLTWNPAEIDASYVVYRSETNKKPADYLARPTTTFFEDETAKRGRTYYYWVDVDDGINSPVESEPVIGCRVLEQVSAPQFYFTDGDTFMSSSKKISISCETSGATVHYTVDGTEPTEDSPVYSKAFSVYATTTVKAIALKEGMRASNVASATITRIVPVSAGEALDVDFMVTTGGTGEWIGYSSVTAKVGGDCLKSGNVGDDESTWIQVVVSGKGTFSFWWKTSCEEDDSGAADWDAAIFTAPDADRAEIRRDGIMADWEQITVTFATEGEHTLRWTYKKDESEKDGEDCLYLDGFSWTPATTGPIVWTVTFNKNAVDAQGVAESKEIEDGTAIGTLPTLTRNGYTFDGWWTASDSGVAVTAATVVTADITLYAKWTALPVPTSLAITGATSVMAGGTATYTCMVTRNDGTSGLVSPTWSITSGGAYASINSSGVLNANGIAIPQSVTIQASYSQNGTTKTATKTVTINTRTVTITFNPNGGTVSPTTRSYTAYGTYGSLPSATYTGNSFSGWFTTVNGGTQITESSTVPASATTLYAHWTENPPPTPTYTESTPVPVRHDWLAKYAGILAAAGNDYEAAAMRPTGKKDGKGNALCVWHDYVAGTDPTNANSRFTAKVQFDGGVPRIGWEPDLNENGTKSERFYKVFGKKTLAANENWTRIADEADQKDYNFFKVTVNMEETPDTEEELKFGDGSGTGGGTDGGGINVDDNGDERPITLESPYNFSAAGTGYGYIQLRWRSDMSYSSDNSKWVDFCVYRANVNDITMATKVATMSMHATYIPKEYEDRVDGFDTYYYWIRTETGTARSEWSAVASAALYLSGPKNLTATCDRYEGVMLEWDALSEATSYKVYADDEGGWSYNFTREVGETTGNSILDDDAPIGTKVRYKVLVVSPYAYEYSYSTVLGARYSGEQTAPDIAGSGNTEGIGISWQPVIGAVAYDIYRNTRNESSSATKIGTLASSGLNNGNSIGYTDKTVDIGTTYYYWVKAVYAANESGFSQVFSAAKFAPHPTNAKATSLRSDGIMLTWEPAAGATSYRIYSGSVMLTETTVCRWLDTSIAQGSSRTYTKVTSVCAAGEYEIGGYVHLTGYRTSSDTIASVTMTGASELELSSNNKITLLCTATMSSGEELSINPDSWDFSELPEGAYQYEKPNEYLYLTIDRNCFIGAGAKTVTIWATWTANERDCDPTVYNLSHTVVIHPSE